MAVPAEARAGHTVGLYRLHEVLGSGAMGVVYRGEHLYLGKEVAIKVLRVGLPRREQAVKSFLREARAASRITHAGIVAVTDFGKADDGTVFLVMELVRGEPLDFIIEREQRLHPARAMNLAMQIADASAAAHQQGIIHRDLKPANVMVSTRVEWSQGAGRPAGTDSAPNRTAATIFETIKLLDFGVAEMNDPETGGWLADPDTIVGTAEYIAPEVVHGMGVDPRADIYSLGVILYEMLTGSVPFRGVSAVDTMLKAAADPVPPLQSHGLDVRRGDGPGCVAGPGTRQGPGGSTRICRGIRRASSWLPFAAAGRHRLRVTTVAGCHDRGIGRYGASMRTTKVRDIMSDVVETLQPGDTVARARRQLELGGIHHLPVVDADEHVIGLVTYHRVLEAWIAPDGSGAPAPDATAVETIMQKDVLTVDQETSAAEAARLLDKNRFGSLPVTEDDKLVGIVTAADFVRVALRYLERELHHM